MTLETTILSSLLRMSVDFDWISIGKFVFCVKRKVIARCVTRCDMFCSLSVWVIAIAVLLVSGQWKKPSSFYLKYESAHIEQELTELQEEKEHIKKLKAYMKVKGW
jgi:hypothetical protein